MLKYECKKRNPLVRRTLPPRAVVKTATTFFCCRRLQISTLTTGSL